MHCHSGSPRLLTPLPVPTGSLNKWHHSKTWRHQHLNCVEIVASRCQWTELKQTAKESTFQVACDNDVRSFVLVRTYSWRGGKARISCRWFPSISELWHGRVGQGRAWRWPWPWSWPWRRLVLVVMVMAMIIVTSMVFMIWLLSPVCVSVSVFVSAPSPGLLAIGQYPVLRAVWFR